MATATPWTTTDDTHLTLLHTAETPVRAMAAELGRGRSSITRRLTHLGLSSTRTQTVAATQTRIADAASKRSALELTLLDDAERLRLQIFSPTVVFNFGGKDNTYEEHGLPQPPHADQLKLMQAVGLAIDRSLKISVHDVDGGVVAAGSLLERLAERLGVAGPAQ